MRWEGQIEPNTKNDGLICLVDMMATFAHIIDYNLENDMGEDSFNMLPLITGQKQKVRETLVMHDYQGRYAVRKGHKKLVDDELYNLKTDLQEKNNVASEHPKIVKELKALLEKQQDAGSTVKNKN